MENIPPNNAPLHKPKHFVAIIVLGILIMFTLITVFSINYVNNQFKSIVEIIQKNLTVYVSGLAALFIIIFYLFFWAYRKLLIVLTLLIFGCCYATMLYTQQYTMHIKSIYGRTGDIIDSVQTNPDFRMDINTWNHIRKQDSIIHVLSLEIDSMKRQGVLK
jgi:predicted membrane metal-binding protein